MSVTLTGGPFTDAKAVAVASGTLRLKLSKEGRRSGGQVCPAYQIDIPLDVNGSIATNTAVYGNDELTPSDTYYVATVLDSNRSPVYGPVLWTLSGGGTVNVNTINPVTGVASAGVSVDFSADQIFLDRANQDVLLSRASANVLQLGTGDSFIPQTDQGVLGSSLKRWIINLFNAVFYGATSGSTTLQASATASGTLTLPAATDTLVGLATADTLTNKTLTTPVIGSAGATFNGATSGSTVLKATAIASGTVTMPAATDTLVGKATTDALTNKTLAGATTGNSVTLLNQQGALAAVVGTGADANAFSYSMPASTMQAGKGIRVKGAVKHTTGSASVTYKLKIGSTTLFAPATADATNDLFFEFVIFNNAGVQNAQTALIQPLIGGTTIIAGGGQSTATENTANTLSILLTFSVAASDQVTPRFFLVEQIN